MLVVVAVEFMLVVLREVQVVELVLEQALMIIIQVLKVVMLL
jgi:hypothetical protein